MLNILIGIVSGIVSGMGMGGGTILILCLSVFLGIEQHVSQGANLVFFIPTSIVSIITNIKQKFIKWKTGITVAIFGIIRSYNTVLKFQFGLETAMLKRCFGIFLLIIAIIQIMTFIKKKKQNKV